MDAAIYFPLFLVLVAPDRKKYSIFYLPSGLQQPGMFQMRTPLSLTARRSGWQGFVYKLESMRDRFVRLR